MHFIASYWYIFFVILASSMACSGIFYLRIYSRCLVAFRKDNGFMSDAERARLMRSCNDVFFVAPVFNLISMLSFLLFLVGVIARIAGL